MPKHVHLRCLILLILACMGTFKVWAQSPFLYRHYTTEDGLPHNVGYDFCQDEAGYLYIGTDNGLVRFDGSRFEMVDQGDPFPTPYVITLSKAPDGKVWAGLHREGMMVVEGLEAKYEPSLSTHIFNPKAYFFSPNYAILGELHPARARNIFVVCKADLVGNWNCKELWMAGNGDSLAGVSVGAAEYPFNTSKYSSRFGGEKIGVREFCNWPSGGIVLASRQGLYQMDSVSKFRKLTNTGELNPECFDVDHLGHLWIGTDFGIFNLRPGEQELNMLIPFHEPIQQIKAGKNGWLFFVPERSREIWAVNLISNELVNLSQVLGLKNRVSFIYLDQSDHLWISTHGDGIYQVFCSIFSTFQLGSRLFQQFVLSTQMGKENNVWISTRRQVFWGDKRGQIQEVTDVIPETYQRRFEIKSMTAQGDDAWIVASEHLFRISVSREDTIGRLMQTSSSDFVFLSSAGQLMRMSWPFIDTYEELDCIKRMQIGDGVEGFRIYSVQEFDDGTLWCATHKGLYVGTGDVAKKYEFNHLLPAIESNDLLRKGDSLWVTTEGGLALILEGKVARTWIPEGEPGLPRLRNLEMDENGRLWMASPNGLYCLIGDDFYRFSMAHGLPAKDVNHVMIDRDHTLWVSTSLGIAQLDLNQPLPLADPPNIFWKTLKVNDQARAFDQLSNLKATARLQIDLGCINMLYADKISWQMRVKKEDPWQRFDTKTITLSNLQPGNYNLQVRARLPHSSWQELEPITWVIMRPWYQRPGLMALMVFGLMVISLGFVYIRQVRKRQALAEKLEIQQQMAVLELKGLQAQLNPHFIFNALNAIQHSVVTQDVLSANHYLTRFAHLLRRFLEASRVRKHSLQAEMELLDQYLELEALCYEGRFEYEIELTPGIDAAHQMVPVMLLQPLVENAVRHGLLGRSTPGLLRVIFLQLHGRLVAIVEDNGVGRGSQAPPSASRYPSRGLEILRSRIDTHNRAEGGDSELLIVDLKGLEGEILGTRALVFL